MPELMDLRDIAFISAATSVNWQQLTSGSTASGTLTVTDDTPATTARITLIGQYLEGNFHIPERWRRRCAGIGKRSEPARLGEYSSDVTLLTAKAGA